MKLRWTRHAIADREEILGYLAERSPRVAVLLDERVEHQLALLRDFPKAGRSGRVAGTRELYLRRTPFIAVYAIDADAVRILRLIHGARKWPPATAR